MLNISKGIILDLSNNKILKILIVTAITSLSVMYSAAESNTIEPYEPIGILLTWQQDPTTTMTIDWHTVPGARRPQPTAILYKKEGSESEWKEKPGTFHAFPYTSRTVNRVELTGLEPGTTYLFRIGPLPSDKFPFPQSRIYKFRTMPTELDHTIRFAVGGDSGSGDSFRSVAAQAAANDIEFVVFGGDLAYANGGDRDWRTSGGEFDFPEGNESKRRWLSWFDIVKDEFVTDEGRVIPVLAGIGNHEVWWNYLSNHPDYIQNEEWRERLAPIYYNIFAFPDQPGYAVLDFSDYMSIILLDTGHSNTIPGKQTGWLDRVLAERQYVTNIFPVYHIASYPSVRPFNGTLQTEIREYWAPLFERSNIKVAFENHDHTYKRTYPIRNSEVDSTGVVYMGDGAFGLGEDHGSGGRRDRMHDVDKTWYLKKASPYSHLILVTLEADGGSLFEAIRYDGELMDSYRPRK